jgi:DNA-binding CsgD family transcriptional regulator
VLVNLALVFLFQGEYERARTLLEEAAVPSRESGDSWSIANSLWILALVISFQGNLARAYTLLEESLALSRQEGYKGGIASSLFVSGQVALQRGDTAIARSRVEESLALFKELGEEAFKAACAEGRTMTPEQALAAQGPVTMPTTALAFPDGLTDTEVKVLRLVAQGLTDAQVAERRVISPHTVNSHLKSIYSKIGVSSRSAATRYAIDHGLLDNRDLQL